MSPPDPFLTLPYESPYRFAPHPKYRHPHLPVGRWCIVAIRSRLARESASYATGCGGRRPLAHADLALAAPVARICWRCARAWARYAPSTFPLVPALPAIRTAHWALHHPFDHHHHKENTA